MAMGKRSTGQQQELFIPTERLPKSPGHVFYRKLNTLLAEAGFDDWVEKVCGPYYANGKGRPSLPPGNYFRMLLVGYFEGIGSQRGIAWRCSDSLSLREFLAIPADEDSPDHSSLSYIRERLPLEVHSQVFVWILSLARVKNLLKGKNVGVDSTTLEANAAMKSIVRTETGEDWKEYLTRLMKEQGAIDAAATPSDEDLRKFDKQRKDKKVSNDEWHSETDPDARICHMKDGTTHLAYKAEHAVDLDSELIVAAEIYFGNEHDTRTLEDTLLVAQVNLTEAGSDVTTMNVPADKGYHSAKILTELAKDPTVRTYIAEPDRKHDNVWTDKPLEQKAAVYANRRRAKGSRGRKLQRLRSERVERTFAHVCETGGARRTWLRGADKVYKRYLLAAVAHNLGVLMRALFGMGTPRGLQQFRLDLSEVLCLAHLTWLALRASLRRVENAWQCLWRSRNGFWTDERRVSRLAQAI
jgi:transposase